MSVIKELQQQVIDFGEQRGWRQFHCPKNLAMALSVESSELVEIFQWLNPEQSQKLSPEQKAQAQSELADVVMYALLFADASGIDIEQAVREKLLTNEQRFPQTK
ncbi:nucleotide pyrophosphohydrolase [Agaribacterium haliotis]|uniref:nucleotide pyrophosphohydrolase n=1 Tax=Agaribacterium haliotis TaxID=2013869 RepID=UPI000BB5454E|nr:nucleotide pyrophosphohydrolase [Agaribacterium haliotis]